MRWKPDHVPQPTRHSSGQAVVRIQGQDHYLGPFGTPAARAAYDRVIAEWLGRGRQLPSAPEALSVNEVMLGYLRHALAYYRKDGKPTSELHCIRSALRMVKRLYGNSDADSFDAIALQSCLEGLVKEMLARQTINKHLHRIRRMFRWAAKQKLVPASVYHELLTVDALKLGRTDAPEGKPVKPVAEAFVDKVRPLVSPQVRAMIDVQLLTGMRPGEVCILRACDIDMSGRVWMYRPESHKLQHHGRTREVYIGPQAQAIIRSFLKPQLGAFLFSPADAEETRSLRRRKERRTPLTPSQARRQRKPSRKRPWRDHYTVVTYRRAIARACEKAKVPVWAPNQLRHNAATQLRKEYGIELARIILGHSTAFTTEIYAEADRQHAVEVIAKVG